MPPGGVLALLDRHGRVMVHYPDHERWIGRTLPETPLLAAITAGREKGLAEGDGMDGAAWVGGDLFFLRRVNALLDATGRLEAGDGAARTGLPRGRGDLDRLAATFDRMAAGLEERTIALRRQAANQRFLAHASSQLCRQRQ
jgi:hypothetical protein